MVWKFLRKSLYLPLVSTFLSIMLTLALVGMIIYIIAENQHPVQTLAWVLVIIFLPVVGLVLFFLIGHRPSRRRLIPIEDKAALKRLTHEAQAGYEVDVPETHQRLVALMEEMNQSHPVGGNALKPYLAFYPMLEDLLDDLSKAQHHIHFEFFKFENDEAGQRVAEVLRRKAAEGVAVRVQYDDLANLSRRKFYRELKKAGIQVKPFIALTIPFLSPDTNFRNHRKVVVIDGKVGYLGGMNIAKRYGDGLPWGPWRDTHLRVEGPAVAELQTAFLTDWRFSSGELLDQPRYYPAVPAAGDKSVQIISSGPMDEWYEAMQGFVQLVSNARSYVYIQTPYFIPTASVMLALKNAALSGVDIQLMIPWSADNGPIVSLASRSYVAEALGAGVKIWFYKKGFLHSKTVVSDDSFTTIGSTNVDVRSYTLDFEINAYVYDRELALQMKEAFCKDCEDAESVELAQWKKRSVFQKLKESLARLLSPLL